MLDNALLSPAAAAAAFAFLLTAASV